MNYIGVIPVKANSKRFPNKNIKELNDKPLFCHSIDALYFSPNISKIFVPTNSQFVKDYINLNYGDKVDIIDRSINISKDDDPLLTVLKFVHYSIDIEYDKMVVIMANCPGHNVEFVNKALELVKNTNSLEFRSFNSRGEENGLMIFDRKVIEFNNNISAHICFAVNDSASEIHYENELNEFKNKFNSS